MLTEFTKKRNFSEDRSPSKRVTNVIKVQPIIAGGVVKGVLGFGLYNQRKEISEMKGADGYRAALIKTSTLADRVEAIKESYLTDIETEMERLGASVKEVTDVEGTYILPCLYNLLF